MYEGYNVYNIKNKNSIITYGYTVNLVIYNIII